MTFLRSRGMRILLALAGTLLMAGIGATASFYLAFVQDLPDLRGIQDYRPHLASRVLDRSGAPLGTFFEQRRTLTAMTEIPRHVVQAFVAAEDSSFFEHSGIDYASILRAAWVNLRAGGEIKQGASTITQQMVKGLLLSPERKYRRKIREMLLARRIERRFSKQEILYLYLNQIYFGHGAYGIGEAARTYFDKQVGTLSISEGAMLAGLPKAPSRYSPFRDPKESEKRRRYVLSRMREDRLIKKETYATALSERPVLADREATKGDPWAAYFSEEVRRYLFDELGSDLVLRGGLTIETTLDAQLQRTAVASLQRGLVALDHRQGYRGPQRRVSKFTISDELRRVAEENDLVANPAAVSNFEILGESLRAQARELLAIDGSTLIGVITAVNAEAKTAQVGFAPGVEGIVAIRDVSWARPPDPNRSPYAVRSIEDIFVIGDVAHFAAAPPESGDLAEPISNEAPALRVQLHQDPIVQGALLSIDVESNEVLAFVGGYDFEKSQFNRVTQARRQPGSAFKPIIYAASLSQNYTPASIIFDRPVVYTDEESGFIWRPRNYKRSFYGPITLREALARSINNATVHLFRDVGIDFVIEYARRLGIESPLNRDLSLALGSSDLSLLELTRAYGVFPAGGRLMPPIFIRRVTDRDGEVLLENVALGTQPGKQPLSESNFESLADVAAPNETAVEDDVAAPHETAVEEDEIPEDPHQVITPEEAFLATSLLRAVVEDPHGTGWRLRELKRPLAGKTGTTNDQADAWFVGFSADITTGVWVGHDESRFLGYGETGSRAAAPIWVDYMRAALRDRPVKDFKVPGSIVFARIDRKTGLLADANSEDTLFQAFLEGTEPSKTVHSERTTSESRRELRLDSF